MQAIAKISDITAQDLADFLRITEPTNDDTATLETLLNVATSYVINHTGRTSSELDNYPDMVIVILILVQDMYDNRTLYVDSSNLNNVVESILGLHAVNLL